MAHRPLAASSNGIRPRCLLQTAFGMGQIRIQEQCPGYATASKIPAFSFPGPAVTQTDASAQVGARGARNREGIVSFENSANRVSMSVGVETRTRAKVAHPRLGRSRLALGVMADKTVRRGCLNARGVRLARQREALIATVSAVGSPTHSINPAKTTLPAGSCHAGGFFLDLVTQPAVVFQALVPPRAAAARSPASGGNVSPARTNRPADTSIASLHGLLGKQRA
jgi:hypothetical protein